MAGNRPDCRRPYACAAKGAGHCRSCHQAVVIAAKWRDPAYRQGHVERMRARHANAEFRARFAAAGAAARRVVWTAEMDAALVRLRAQGTGVIICAEQIGVGAHVCRRRIRELGLRFSDDRDLDAHCDQ